MFIVYGEKYKPCPPFINSKTNEVIYDGLPVKIQLSSWTVESLAKGFAENVKSNVPKRSWNIWIEEIS
jgi:hypothetical protein